MPRVSIIMGIYNCAPYLQEALDSLYAQSFQDFEIILCDDGSTDSTYEVAKMNLRDHKNIILLKNENNLGLNKTLNKCLEMVTGEYTARMDGDDVSLPTRLEEEVHFLDRHPEYAIVSTPMIYYDDKGEFGRGKTSGEPKKEDIIDKPPFCHAPCMIRTAAYRAVGGYTEDPKLLRYEDYNLWMKMYLAGFRGFVLSECLYAMRDDRAAIKRRNFQSRMRGIYAHYLAYRKLHLSTFRFCKYVIRSFLSAIMPVSIYAYLHKKKISK